MPGIAVMGAAAGSPGVIQAMPSEAIHASLASVSLNSSGAYTMTGQSGGSWVSPTQQAGLWQVRCTELVGATSSGSIGSWLALTSTRTWTKNTSFGAFCTIRLEFRDAATQVVRSTKEITMSDGGV